MLCAMLISLLLLTVGGMFLTLALCPVSKITWQFFRLIGVIVFGITTFAVVWFLRQGGWSAGWQPTVALILAALAGVSGVTVITISPLLHSRVEQTEFLLRAAMLTGGVAGFAAGLFWPTDAAVTSSAHWYVAAASHVLGGLFLGSVSVAWLLGHRYLTASEMTIDPLKKASQLLIIALGARWGFLALMIVAALLTPVTAQTDAGPLAQMAAEWITILLRVGIGLVLPTVFAYMIWQCVKLRSTQSATGILFFMSIFVVIGELTSRYLADRSGFVL